MNDENQDTAGGVCIDVDGKLFPAFYGADVQDVAASSGVSVRRCERAIPVFEIGAGAYELSVVVLTANRTGYYEPEEGVELEVR